MFAPISLQNVEPLAKGSARLVFEMPGRRDLLVKVLRPKLLETRYGANAAWFRRRRRHGPYILFVREIEEFVAGHSGKRPGRRLGQTVCGLVETDLGLGLVVEAVRDADGNLAPTVAKLIAGGRFDEAAEEALEVFLADLLESDLVIADLHERNLVLSSAPDGKPCFVMIDGLGSSTWVPFKAWSRTLNRRSKIKRIRRLRQRIARRVASFQAGNPLP